MPSPGDLVLLSNAGDSGEDGREGFYKPPLRLQLMRDGDNEQTACYGRMLEPMAVTSQVGYAKIVFVVERTRTPASTLVLSGASIAVEAPARY